MRPPLNSLQINSHQLFIPNIKPAGASIPDITMKKACTRTPLSNITNIPPSTKLEPKRDKRKGKAVHNDWENIPLKDWSRNLFDDEFSKTPNTAPHLYDDKGCVNFENGNMTIIFVFH